MHRYIGGMIRNRAYWDPTASYRRSPVRLHGARSIRTLDDLAGTTCQAFGVSLEALRSPGKQRLLSAARRSLALEATEQRIASLSDVARYLHRSVSGIARLVERAHCQPQSGKRETR